MLHFVFIVLNAIRLIVVMLDVVMLSVVVPPGVFVYEYDELSRYSRIGFSLASKF